MGGKEPRKTYRLPHLYALLSGVFLIRQHAETPGFCLKPGVLIGKLFYTAWVRKYSRNFWIPAVFRALPFTAA